MGAPTTDKPSIRSRRPLRVHLLPWLYRGNSYWRVRANQNMPKVQERTLRHRSNELCRAVWHPHWPLMQKHLVRPQYATGFQIVFVETSTFRPKDYSVVSCCSEKTRNRRTCRTTSERRGGAVANRLRRRTSDQTVLGSNPAMVAALSPWTRLFTPIVPRRSLHISFY